MKVQRLDRKTPNCFEYAILCPGCGSAHGFKTDGAGPCWSFNGDMERPTISPSLLVNRGRANPTAPTCHSFVRDGRIKFLSDSTHGLAGQTVALPDWEDDAW